MDSISWCSCGVVGAQGMMKERCPSLSCSSLMVLVLLMQCLDDGGCQSSGFPPVASLHVACLAESRSLRYVRSATESRS